MSLKIKDRGIGLRLTSALPSMEERRITSTGIHKAKVARLALIIAVAISSVARGQEDDSK